MVETVVSGKEHMTLTLQKRKKKNERSTLPLQPKFMEQNRPDQTIFNGGLQTLIFLQGAREG